MTHLVTYADDRMSISADSLIRSALAHGVNIAYQSEEVPTDVRLLMEPTISEPKGAGLYIWKPWVVFNAISNMHEGDILIYADAGQTIISNVQPVIDAMDEDIMLFGNGWNHMDWCKMDVAAAMLPDSEWGTSASTKAQQVQASLIFFRVNENTRNFVKEWLLWCLMPGFCDNSPSKLPNVSTFQETRWDQSILTNLQIKHGYKLHWFPTVTNHHRKADFPNDHYPAISDHHRRRNPGATNNTDSEW